LSAHLLSQQHFGSQCFILDLIITSLEGKSWSLLDQQSIQSLQDDTSLAALLIGGSINKKNPVEVTVI